MSFFITHRCATSNLVLPAGLVQCSTCELALEPAETRPAEPHGFVTCDDCGSVFMACPLGVAEMDLLRERKRIDSESGWRHPL